MFFYMMLSHPEKYIQMKKWNKKNEKILTILLLLVKSSKQIHLMNIIIYLSIY